MKVFFWNIKVEPRIPLKEALPLYWKNLVPVSAFASVTVVITKLTPKAWHLDEFLLALFFLTFFCAAYPCLMKGVTFGFWGLAMGCYILGVIPAYAVLGVAKLIQFIFHH